jgi:hypothetical protein
MRDVSNTTGPVSYGETSWETGDTPEAFTGKAHYQELIHRANTVPLIRIFKYYKLRIDAVNCFVTCPFKSHKGGRENTGSFKYYAPTNSFFCFGCRVGGESAHACEFMAHMEEITRAKAANKIITLFASDVDEDAEVFEGPNFSERLEIMMDFSNVIREFRLSFFDEKATAHIEEICAVYDTLNFRHKLDNEALRRCVEELKEEVKNYKPCLTL